jgi:hypothetical protein
MMSMVVRNAFQLVDGLLDEGLDYVATYLEKSIKRSIIIADHQGQIHYPNLPINSARIDNVFIQLPSSINSKNYFYRETDKCLFYPIEWADSFAYIIIENLSFKMLAPSLAILCEAKLAIKYYFTNLSKSVKNTETFTKRLSEYLFFPNQQNITDIFTPSEMNCRADRLFYASIMEFDETTCATDWQKIASYSRELLKKSHPDVITLVGSNCLTAIIPARNMSDQPDQPLDCHRLIKLKETIEASFKLSISLGFGQSHSFTDIKKSYYEARIALTLPRLMGAKRFTQAFSDLGLAALVFSSDIETLKSYCQKCLGKVMDYDHSNHSDLMVSLRLLLDNNYNWKSTADQLFIHINTLYYRMNKIEQLLDINLSKMNSRVNVYVAIKVFDTLKMIGFLD